MVHVLAVEIELHPPWFLAAPSDADALRPGTSGCVQAVPMSLPMLSAM